MNLGKILSAASVPEEIAYNLPYINMAGCREAIIENHLGITEYTPTCVKIKTVCGNLAVIGKNLTMNYISKEEIKISGEVYKCEYIGKGGV